MNLARSGILDYAVALEVTTYLNHERNYVPWKAAISNLLYIDSMLIRTPDYDKMKVMEIRMRVGENSKLIIIFAEIFHHKN